MTLNELIQRLEEYRDELEGRGDAEVRMMNQYNWPFEYTIAGVTCNLDFDDDNEDADPVVYICEGQQLGYGTKQAWDQI